MTGLDGLIRALELDALVPDDLARYRPAVVEGLAFFLERMDPARRRGILAAQAALPSGAGPHERLVVLAAACPALHKLGQTLARDRRLPAGLRALLQGLETMPCTRDPALVRADLERELGPLAAAGIELDGPPLAQASVAVVVPATLREVAPGGRRAVLKVLRPGIEGLLAEDLELLAGVGTLLDERTARHGLPPLDYGESFAAVRELLGREVHLDQEQSNMRTARAAYRDMPDVVVPEVFAPSTPRVTAMERLDGRGVTDPGVPAHRRRRLAHLIVAALVAHPVLSAAEETPFHADPHAGNLLALDGGRLGVLDWSLVGLLRDLDLLLLTDLVVAASLLDAPGVCRAVAALAGGAVDAAALRRVAGDALAAMRTRAWPDLAWLVGLLDAAATGARARFGPGLLAFRKVLLTLEGVVADVAEDACPDDALVAAVLAQLAREWGPRTLAPPASRAFGTHLSNADLARLAALAPLVLSRAWLAAAAGPATASWSRGRPAGGADAAPGGPPRAPR